MAQRVYTGQDGTLESAEGTAIAKVISFSVTANLDTLETTSLGDNHRIYIPGVLSYNGNASIMYSADATGSNIGNRLTPVFRTTAADSPVVLRLKLTGGKLLAFNAYIINATIGVTTGEVVRADIAFQSNGAPASVTI